MLPARRVVPAVLALAFIAVLALTVSSPTAAHASTPTATTLTVTSSCLTQGCAVTLTAKVAAGAVAIRPGLVYFCEGTVATCKGGLPVGQAQLTANGTAAIAHVFSTGTHNVYAIFAGTLNSSMSISSTQEITIAPPPVFPTATTLSFGLANQEQGNYTFAATVQSLKGGPAPTGVVAFYDRSYGDAALGSASLTSSATTVIDFVPNQLDFSQIPSLGAAYTFVGDFNGDGFNDLMINTAVLLGDASGKFKLAPYSPLQAVPRHFTADFNSDGKLDIANIDYTGQKILISFGKGDGTFSPAISTSVPNFVYGTTLGDFNGDGIPDLAMTVQVTSNFVYAIQIALGNGNGTFNVLPATYLAGVLTNPTILVADEDRDGKQDLIVEDSGTYTSQLQTLHGNGDGTFTPIAATTQNFGALSLIEGDFNADGIADIVTYDGAIITLWQGVGDGTFIQPDNGNDNIAIGALRVNQLFAGDFNHDGHLDLGIQAIDPNAGQEKFIIFTGNPTLSGQFSWSGTNSPVLYQFQGNIGDGSTLAIGDLNGDGTTDIVYTPSADQTIRSFVYSTVTSVNTTQTSGTILSPTGPHQVIAKYAGAESLAPSVSDPTTLPGSQAIDESGGFTDSTALSLNGGATVQGGILQLTDGKTFEARSAFYQKRVPVYNFSTTFDFQIPSQNSDGLAFVIQSNGPNAVGSNGGGLGYGQTPGATGGPSIPNSVAVIFDTHNNEGEGNNSIRVETGGVTNLGDLIDLTSSGIDLRSGHSFRVVISGYDGGFLSLSLTDLETSKVFRKNFITLDIVSAIGDTIGYVGFTSATGATASTVDILNWTYAGQICCASPATAVLPSFPDGFTNAASTIQLNKGAAIVGSELQLTNDTPFEATSAFFKTPNDEFFWISDFDFTIQGTGGDGFTFLVQTNGPGAVGTSGGALGYGPYLPGEYGYGIGNSLAIKFDVHNNGGEGINSTGLYFDGAFPSVPAIDLTSSRINLRSGHRFHARILSAKDATIKMSITDLDDYAVFDNFSIYSRNDDNDLYHAYPGFTAGTGATTNTIKILNWTFGYY